MCVIVRKPPKVEIPIDRLRVACSINHDGFGLAVIDRGKIEVIKGLPENGKHLSDKVAKALEQAKDQHAFLHLRYKTKGKLDENNLHPFSVFDRDGQKIMLMHNGTIHGYGNNEMSDSWEFSEKLVKPMLERWNFENTEELLKDDLLPIILSKLVQGDRVLLFDHLGNDMVVNRGSWEELPFVQPDGSEIKVLASNEYSFHINHTRYEKNKPEGTVVKLLPKGHGSEDARSAPWFDKWAKQESGPSTSIPNFRIKEAEDASKTKRPTFVQLTGMTSLLEVLKLTREDILQLIEEYPEYVATLVQDLRDLLLSRKDIIEAANTNKPDNVG